MNNDALDVVAAVAAEEYIAGTLKPEIVKAIRERVDVSADEARLMVAAIDAHEDQRISDAHFETMRSLRTRG